MLFISMCGAILVVLDFLIDLPFALAITGGLALVFVVLWVVLPIMSRIEEANSHQVPPGGSSRLFAHVDEEIEAEGGQADRAEEASAVTVGDA